MIIVKLMGGLGNQMFQYAAARRLSLLHRVQLKFDLSWFNSASRDVTTRNFELSNFKIQGEEASATDVAKYNGIICKFFSLTPIRFVLNTTYFKERQYEFDDTINLFKDLYLDGYWQSYKYFESIEEIIKADFTLTKLPEGENRRVCSLLEQSHVQTVALHIRRGDYYSNAAAALFHGICSLDYYHQAITFLEDRISNLHFYIFSDDPIWVKEHLIMNHPTFFVTHNGPDNGYEDLRLMSLCKHHIIANSTFSWWGAWLSQRPDKIVIAPKKWFKDTKINTDDLIPGQWIRL